MTGKGRSNNNAYVERLCRTLKYEWTIINGAKTVADYKKLLPTFIRWYNYLRPHQALRYQTPGEVQPDGYVDKASTLPHMLTKATIPEEKNSLIL